MAPPSRETRKFPPIQTNKEIDKIEASEDEDKDVIGTGEGKVVCVTGGSGYIATWLTKLLLERDYTVRATVRNLNDHKKTEHLLALDGATERLQLFEADLLKEGSFDSAIDGCEGVFHTASPCYPDCKDPQAELIDPAVKGTVNVLASCAKASSVKRVVLTSSVASMLYNRRPQTLDTVADESWESDREFCIERKLWYGLSKMLAEEAAWKFANEKGINMVTANPGLVIGPMLQQTLNFSSAVIASFINNGMFSLLGGLRCSFAGLELEKIKDYNHIRSMFELPVDIYIETGGYGDTRMVWIHVRDVAHAHILLFENPSASGRYALVESAAYFSEIVSIIHELHPNIRLPNMSGEGIFPDLPPTSKEKMKAMGMDSYIPLKMGLKETIESLKEKRIITI